MTQATICFISSSKNFEIIKHILCLRPIDLMHDDVTCPERQYGSCSHAQIQDGYISNISQAKDWNFNILQAKDWNFNISQAKDWNFNISLAKHWNFNISHTKHLNFKIWLAKYWSYNLLQSKYWNFKISHVVQGFAQSQRVTKKPNSF